MILSVSLVIAFMSCGLVAGIFGSMVGIGGGLIVVPTLVLVFGVDIKTAVACSLIAVVASSTAAGSVYVGKGLTNMRLAMFLEMATVLGGISGGYIALSISPTLVSGLFSGLMLAIGFLVLKTKDQVTKVSSETVQLAIPASVNFGFLSGTYYDSFQKSVFSYQVVNHGFGAVVSFLAGILSGLFGIGGGFLQVPAMTLAMKVPMRVASATSNFTMGVTAVSSLFVYFSEGLVAPLIAVPVAFGVIVGAFFGTLLADKFSPKVLRNVLFALLIAAAIQMFLKSLGVSLGR
jgi:uncharacterized membrane protein YfcA